MIHLGIINALDNAQREIDEFSFCGIFGDELGSNQFGVFEWHFDRNLVGYLRSLSEEQARKVISYINNNYRTDWP